MPRDGSGIYSTPPGTHGTPNTTILSANYNSNVDDVAADLNTPRPIVAGGTGATTAADALATLGGETAKQVITNYDSGSFVAGSFYSASGATNPPVAGHAFSGICYLTDASNMFIEARDQDDTVQPGTLYVRQKKAGAWSAWLPTGAAVRYDAPQALTAAQQSQARANINVTKKNYALNGAMMISQENGATSGTANAYYPVDQFWMIFANAGTQTAQQVSSPTPGGSPNRIRITATIADASVASGDYCFLNQRIEGRRAADLRLGSALAKTVTLQFGVKAPAGTYCISLQNGSGSVRSYIAEYVIAPGEANTDVVKSVTIALDQTGIWATDNTTGLGINWMLMMGSSQQTTANSWVGGNFLATANQFNFMGTAGNVFELFDVSFTEGTVAPAFQVPDYASELATCMRYYWKDAAPNWFETESVSVGVGSNNAVLHIWYPEFMRASPTLTLPTSNLIGANTPALTVNSGKVALIKASSTVAAGGRIVFYYGSGSFVADARL